MRKLGLKTYLWSEADPKVQVKGLQTGKILKKESFLLDTTYIRLIKSKKERNLDLIVSKEGKIVRIPAKRYDINL